MMKAAFPNMPAETAAFAVGRIIEKRVGIEDAVELVNRAADDFTPEYGVMYPSVAYLLGRRGSKASANGKSFPTLDDVVVMPDDEFLRFYARAKKHFSTMFAHVRASRDMKEREVREHWDAIYKGMHNAGF